VTSSSEFVLNRAQFLGSLGALALTLSLGGCEQLAQEIANRPTRRNLANLAANDPILVTYRNAITQMQALQNSNPSDPFGWISQANIHANHCPHANWWLFPWHSAYLVYFERICRQLTGDQTFALPYWNWTTTNTVPSIFYNGDVLQDPTEGSSPVTISQEFVGHSVLETILEETNFELFGSAQATTQLQRVAFGGIEGTPHNNVHNSFPGDMANIGLSARDPIFWTHHAMVDYCWVDWQFARGNANPNDPTWANLTFTEFFDQNRNPVNVLTAITPLFAIFDYQYEPSQIGNQVDTIKAIKTRSDADMLKAVVQRGAPSNIPVLQRFELTNATQVNVGAAALGRIPAPKAALQAAVQAGSGQRALLAIQDVTPPAKADVFLRVFVNAPETVSDKTPISDPHYAGSFAFFLMGEGSKMRMGGANFMVDVTDTLRRVSVGDSLDIQLVAVPYPGREGEAHGFAVGGLELAIAKLETARKS
jgi:tyrosinase